MWKNILSWAKFHFYNLQDKLIDVESHFFINARRILYEKIPFVIVYSTAFQWDKHIF